MDENGLLSAPSVFLETLPNCPLCKESLSSARYVLSDNGFNVVQCQRCGLSLVNPRPIEAQIGTYYSDQYYTHVTPRPNLKSKVRERVFLEAGGYPFAYTNFVKRLNWKILASILKSHITPIIPYRGGGRLLDVGCGNGEFLSLAHKAGWDTYGIDIDLRALTLAKNGHHKLICGTLETVKFQPSYFDVITILQVLEHCHNPIQVLEECHRILKDDGLIVVSVPNFDCLERKIFNASWIGIVSPLHLFHFNQVTLCEMLKCAGFQVTDTRFKVWFSISEAGSYHIFKKRCVTEASPWDLAIRSPLIVSFRKVVALVSGTPVSQIAPFITVRACKNTMRDLK